MLEWYVLYTKLHAERQVAAYFAGHGYEVYLPLIPVARPRNDRARERPYLPGYLFVHYDLKAQGLTRLAYTPGLRGVVSFGGEPAAVPAADVNRIQTYLANPHFWDTRGTELKAGDAVEILAPAFESIEAIFDRHLSAEARVRVLLRYLERNQIERKSVERLVPLELDATLVRKKDHRK